MGRVDQCQNPNHTSTRPQPNITLVWFDMKMTLPPHPPHTNSMQQYLSCYCPDFDETLKLGSWEHLEQIPAVTVTFLQATFVKAISIHIKNISTVTDPILMKL